MDDIGIFILSSGSSKRTKDVKHKALLTFDSSALIIYQIRTILNVFDKVNIILGSQADVIFQFCKNNLDGLEFSKVNFYIFDEWNKGRSYSLSHFAKLALNLNLDWCFLVSVDQPISEKILFEMQKNIFNFDADVFLPTYKNKKGHPVLINKKTLEKIKTLRDNPNLILSSIIMEMKVKEIEINDKFIHLNLNNLEDFR